MKLETLISNILEKKLESYFLPKFIGRSAFMQQHNLHFSFIYASRKSRFGGIISMINISSWSWSSGIADLLPWSQWNFFRKPPPQFLISFLAFAKQPNTKLTDRDSNACEVRLNTELRLLQKKKVKVFCSFPGLGTISSWRYRPRGG